MKVFGIRSRAVGRWDVCDKHGWERRCVSAKEFRDGGFGLVEICVSLVGSAGHFDVGAVHVHLTITDFVEPRPCESIRCWSDALRNGEGICIWVRSIGVFTKVSRSVLGGAASLDRVNDHPFGALSCRVISGQGHLT